MAQLWEVVGGSDKGGILVREGADLKSPQTASRLATGALVRELKLVGERLHYDLLEGDGPTSGWVSISLKDKPLLIKTDKSPAGGLRTSIFEFEVELSDGSAESLTSYRSPVTLVVNTASNCGFTKQYDGLQKLHEEFSSKGLKVLAFPCNQFGAQEPGTNATIQEFAKEKYGVTFPVFGKADVNGSTGLSLFNFLKGSVDDPVPRAPWAKDLFPEEKDIQWNFTKFLCVDGKPIKRYSYSIDPSVIRADVMKALANVAVLWKPPPPTGRKLRVMCLHGTAGCEKIFRTQLARLLPALKDDVEMVFVEGPLEVTEGTSYEMMRKFFPNMRNSQYDVVQVDDRGWRIYKDPKGTLEWLQARIKEHGPVDGLLGFSQGANFSAMLCAQAVAGTGAPLGFAVLLSPNAPGYVEQLPELFAELLPIPVMIVRGELEQYDAGMEKIFEERQKKGLTVDKRGEDAPALHVAKLFNPANCEVIAHKEGHRPLPGGNEVTDLIEQIKGFMRVNSQ